MSAFNRRIFDDLRAGARAEILQKQDAAAAKIEISFGEIPPGLNKQAFIKFIVPKYKELYKKLSSEDEDFTEKLLQDALTKVILDYFNYGLPRDNYEVTDIILAVSSRSFPEEEF